MKRRERTRHLIELGGLVQKAGLVDLTRDDRAALYGAFLTLARMLRGEVAEHNLALQGEHRPFRSWLPPWGRAGRPTSGRGGQAPQISEAQRGQRAVRSSSIVALNNA